MPISILEVPTGSLLRKDEARALCEKCGDLLHDTIKVPDPDDKEIRVVEIPSITSPNLRFAFTVGLKEYPDYNPPSFFPTQEQINSAGQAIISRLNNSSLDIPKIDIEAWPNTTFLLREGPIEEPTAPVSEELNLIRQSLNNPRIKIVFSPQKQEGVSIFKESGTTPDNEASEAVHKLANRFGEILGTRVKAETEFAIDADSDISVEFDCDVAPNSQISENARLFLAESALHSLESTRISREGSAEVWIRQGSPTTTSIKNK